MKNKDLSNLYIDISKEILINLSPGNNKDQLLFLICIENSLSHLADDIFLNFKNELKPIEQLTTFLQNNCTMERRRNAGDTYCGT